MSGRPLRFLGATLGGWVAIRMAMLWTDGEPLPELIEAIAPPLAAADLAPRAAAPPTTWRAAVPPAMRRSIVAAPSRWPSAAGVARVREEEDVAAAAAISVGTAASNLSSDATRIVKPIPLAVPADGSRWSGSFWLLARGGMDGTLSGGRLGASQAGARIAFALDERRRVAAVARIATPIKGAGREVAMGIEWRPVALPLRMIAEQRFAIDGGRGGPTAMVVAGIGPAEIAKGFRLEAYGQAGAIARGGIEGFADGAARLTRPVLSLGKARLDVGAGSWGAVQRDAARLDVGPTIGLALPTGFTTLRINADWRQRIAGTARPASGPALSIGADF